MKQRSFIPDAIATLRGGQENPGLAGQIKFYQQRDYVLVEANVKGLPHAPSGFVGFHIHEGKGCTGSGFSGTGNHFNPAGAPHPSHAGDLPPLLLCGGGAYLAVATNRFRVADILGRTAVIHSLPDDFKTQPSGDAGTKIACGVIFKA